MIVDLCKPLNPGESLTVRIIMNVDEARTLNATLQNLGVQFSVTGSELIAGLNKALIRNDGMEKP